MILLAALLIHCSLGIAQSKKAESQTKINKVKLIHWKAQDCDNTYDPYLLVARITESEVSNGVTLLTINFADNCCPEFAPEIEFIENKLFIVPYKQKEVMELCSCNCCFSLQFRITGLPPQYDVFFRGMKIIQSADPYPVVTPSHEVFEGQTVNRMNKYGFREGKWITLYESGQIKDILEYPDNQIRRHGRELRSKSFYESGQLKLSRTRDTTQYWFDDGELMSQFIDYKRGDTTYHYRLKKHDHRRLAERSLERSYPTIFYSELDSSYQSEGHVWNVVYKEEFFENGERKLSFKDDTTRSWHPSGMLHSVAFRNGKITFDTTGHITERIFHWKTRDASSGRDLDNSLYVTYNLDAITDISYVRDKVVKNGYSPGVRSEWKWQNGKLVQAPKNWNSALPWSRFKEIQIE